MSTSPRSARQIIAGAAGLYWRYPLVFPVLAAAVVVPYQVAVLVFTGSGPLTRSSLSGGAVGLLTLIDLVLVSPLVSALHVHAVSVARDGHRPRLVPVARKGLRTLPVVVAASIISGLGIAVGLLALAIPGIILMLRWVVVAQTAAIEHEGWIPALRRSARLSDGSYGHVILFFLFLTLLTSAPVFLVGLGFRGDATTVASFSVGLLLQVIAMSFGALATALLYFDLRVRSETAARAEATGGTGHSMDPRSYTDQTRPKGWYINPSSPGRMVYWGAKDPPDWGTSARTPRRVRRAWEESQDL